MVEAVVPRGSSLHADYKSFKHQEPAVEHLMSLGLMPAMAYTLLQELHDNITQPDLLAACRNTSSWFNSQHAITGRGLQCRRCVLAAVAGGPSWSSSFTAQLLCLNLRDSKFSESRQLDDQARAAAWSPQQQRLQQPAGPPETPQKGLRQQMHSWLRLKLAGWCEGRAPDAAEDLAQPHWGNSSIHSWLCKPVPWSDAGDEVLLRSLQLEQLLATLLVLYCGIGCGIVCINRVRHSLWPFQSKYRCRNYCRRQAVQQATRLARCHRSSAQQAANKAASASGGSSAAANATGHMQQQAKQQRGHTHVVQEEAPRAQKPSSASVRQRGSANGRMALTWAVGSDAAGGSSSSSDDSSRGAGSRSAGRGARDALQDDLLAAVRRAVFRGVG